MKAAVAASGASATVLTDPSSVAWVFNIRGKDVSNTPLPLSFAIIPAQGEPELFIDERKLAIEPRAYLTQLAKLSAPADLEGHLGAAPQEAKPFFSIPSSQPKNCALSSPARAAA